MERPVAYMGEQPYIFVSYSHKDSELVWPIIIKLQEDGFRIWYDDGISPGTEWDTNIAKHIRKCAFFIAFISGNYLNSDNCKDELSFVRELNKNRVLIYLEEVVLPDEMQMRLGRLQAIYWNRYAEKKAYHKLLQSPGIDTCKEPEQPETPTPVKKAEPLKEVNPIPEAAKTSVPSTEPEIPSPPVKINKAKKKPFLFIGAGIALLLILVMVMIPRESTPTSSSTASTQETEQEKDSDKDTSATSTKVEFSWNQETAEAYVTKASSVYTNGVVNSKEGSLLAGTLIADSPASYVFSEQHDLDYNGSTYTVAQLPFITISSFDDQNSIILGFLDKFGRDYYFYGAYSINGQTLTVSPGGSAGSFGQECAPLTATITYTIVLNDDEIRLNYGDDSTHASLCGVPNKDNTLVLKGSLSDGSEPYKGLQSLDLVYDVENETIKSCAIILEDGKIPNDISCQYWPSIHTIKLSWDSVSYELNGGPVTEKKSGSVNFTYINQNPAGFTITNDYRDNIVHYYQDLSGFESQ